MKHALILKDGTEHVFGDEWPEIPCFCCAVCCMGFTPQLTDEEIDRMSAGLEMDREAFIHDYVIYTQIGYLLRQDENGCIFLKREEGVPGARCSIHLHRPDACRDWQARLIRIHCIEGLKLFPAEDGLLRLETLYPDEPDRDKFCGLVELKDRREETLDSDFRRNGEIMKESQ